MAGGSEASGSGFDFFSLLDSARSTDLSIVLAIIAILIGLNFVWEFINEVLEYTLEHHKHILQMVHKLWGELTILGLWSMILFLIQRSFNVDGHLKHIFEYVHFSLFLLSILYILMVVFMALLSAIIFRRWRELEKFDANAVHLEHDQMIAERAYRSRWWILTNPRFAWKYYQSSVQDDYHMIRSHFVEQNTVGEKFPFDKYLKRCMKGIFSELSQVKWFVLAAVLLLQFGLWMPFEMIRREHNIPFAMFCIIEMLLNTLLFGKSFSIVKFLKRHRHILTEPQHVLNRKLKMTLAQMKIKQQAEQQAQAARANRTEKRKSRGVTFQQPTDDVSTRHHQPTATKSSATPPDLPDLEKGSGSGVVAKEDSSESSIQFAEVEYHSSNPLRSSPSTANTNQNTNTNTRSISDATKSIGVSASMKKLLSSSGSSSSPSVPSLPPPLIRADTSNQLRSTGDLFPNASARVVTPHQRSELVRSSDGVFPDDLLPSRKGSLSPEQLVHEAERIRHEKLSGSGGGGAAEEGGDDGYASYTSSSESESDEAEDEEQFEVENDLSSPPQQISSLGLSQSGNVVRTKVRHHHHHHHHHHFHASAAELFVAWKSHEKKKESIHFEEWHWLKGCLWPLMRCKPEQLCMDLPSITNPQHRDHRHYTAHTNLFWFNSPRFFLVLMQILLFFEATYLAIQVAAIARVIDLTVWYLPIPFVVTIFNICLLMPGTIYNYSIAVNVGEFTKEDIMDEVQQKLAAQQREAAKKHSDRHRRHRAAVAAARKVAGNLEESLHALQQGAAVVGERTQEAVQGVVLRPVQTVFHQGISLFGNMNANTNAATTATTSTALSGGYTMNTMSNLPSTPSITSPPHALKLLQSGELTPPATPQGSLSRTFARKHRRVTSAPVDVAALQQSVEDEEEQEAAKEEEEKRKKRREEELKTTKRNSRRSLDLRKAPTQPVIPQIQITPSDVLITSPEAPPITPFPVEKKGSRMTRKDRSHSHEHVHHHHHHHHDNQAEHAPHP